MLTLPRKQIPPTSSVRHLRATLQTSGSALNVLGERWLSPHGGEEEELPMDTEGIAGLRALSCKVASLTPSAIWGRDTVVGTEGWRGIRKQALGMRQWSSTAGSREGEKKISEQ